MWTRLYRYKAYRYLPITVIVAAVLFAPTLVVLKVLLNALLSLFAV